jgi:hypothetical protein
VLTLLAASAVAAATGDTASFVIILVMVTLSVAIDLVQERHAGMAAGALRQSVQIRAVALRDGAPAEIPVREVVPGDVVLLGGQPVPADGASSRRATSSSTRRCSPANRSRSRSTRLIRPARTRELTAATAALFWERRW